MAEGAEDALIQEVERLRQIVVDLERRLGQLESGNQRDLSQLQKVSYQIGRLYVRELSGTLNIGITSIDEGHTLTDLAEFAKQEGVDITHPEEDDEEESWFGEEGWFEPGDLDADDEDLFSDTL